MLQTTNKNVAYYLECASLAHERATLSDNKESRDFHERMVTRWMYLAATAAWIERADLFAESMRIKTMPPADLCNTCRGIMTVVRTEITSEQEKLTFECADCGSQKVRRLLVTKPDLIEPQCGIIASPSATRAQLL